MNKELCIEKATAANITEMQRLFVNAIYSVCAADYNTEQIKVWCSSIENKKRENRS
ncbi:hypothetical protein [Neotamlana sedimentorum]|uniref:hypothetical protein n=1 Tax=Neotamlana sedimentorum TaxID=1435349 RepID=UPI000A757F40|nr:hypothetical protein [Tamlana sedimentorum]